MSEGHVDPGTLAALSCLPGLRAGQAGVRESEPVRALHDHQIEPVIACAPPVVADMIRVQLLTGMRPGELCAMRPVDLDTSGQVWLYTPQRHKNQHRGQGRVIVLGPKAQGILGPYLADRAVHAHVFSPIESEQRRRSSLKTGKASPQACERNPTSNGAPRSRSRLRGHYDAVTYRRAVDRACERAFPVPEEIARDAKDAKDWRVTHSWTPNQLRHTAATRIRSEAGLEMSRIVLGHSTASVTEQFYAEADTAKVGELMRRIG